MLLSARDQENRVFHAAPQNGKNQFPKTPGQGPSKTPFGGKKNGLNDENGAAGVMTLGGKSTFKAHADAFMTPMGPRSRVPLGGKDTNVKANHTITFNDPLQQTKKPNKGPPSSTKQTTRGRRQNRLSVTPAKVVTQEEEEYPEIEYIPPAPKELPDIPDDYQRIDVGIINKTLFRDLNSTPIYNAKRKEQFEKLTRYDEKAEEEEVERKMAEMFGNVEKKTTKVVSKEKKKAPARTFDTATKASLAKRGSSRPGSAQSTRPATSTIKRSQSTTRKPSSNSLKSTSRPGSSLQSTGSISRKQGAIYYDQLNEDLMKLGLDDDNSDMEDDYALARALKETEKEAEDIEKKMMELFKMDEEEEEVYQIPLDF